MKLSEGQQALSPAQQLQFEGVCSLIERARELGLEISIRFQVEFSGESPDALEEIENRAYSVGAEPATPLWSTIGGKLVVRFLNV